MTAKKKQKQTDSFPGHPVDQPENMTVIGRIARPVGVKGELKVIMESALPERLLQMQSVLILIGSQVYRFPVEVIGRTAGWYRIKLGGIDNPEDGSILSGCDLVSSEADRPELPIGEYYIDELIGCRVESDDGDYLGLLLEVMSQGHHDIWVVDGDYGEIMVPAVKEFVVDIDLERHRLVVRSVDGLWDRR